MAGVEEVGEEPDGFLVWQENVETLEVFTSCAGQWRWISGFGSAMRTGLDYTAVQSAIKMLGIKRKRRMEVFEGIHIMEMAVLEMEAKRG